MNKMSTGCVGDWIRAECRAVSVRPVKVFDLHAEHVVYPTTSSRLR